MQARLISIVAIGITGRFAALKTERIIRMIGIGMNVVVWYLDITSDGLVF